MVLYIGIDPGLGGAIARIDSDGTWTGMWDAPIITYKKGKKIRRQYDLREVKCILENHCTQTDEYTVQVFVEEMQSMPRGIRVQASFSIGYSQGMYEGLLTALNIPYQLVKSKEWQKSFQITKARGDTKALSFMTASRLFPTAELTGPKGGKKDGRSDALLIAEWGRRRSLGIQKNES